MAGMKAREGGVQDHGVNAGGPNGKKGLQNSKPQPGIRHPKRKATGPKMADGKPAFEIDPKTGRRVKVRF